MKKIYSHIMMIVLSVGILSSCNEEMIQNESYGFLGIRMDNDLSEDIIVKSDVTADELVFAVGVYNASGQLVAERDDHNSVTTDNPIRLQIGNYNVVASNGTDLNAAFDNPYYEGSRNVRIYADKVNTVELTCSLANTAFSVDFPAEFAEHFDVYEVAVTNGVGDKLVLSNDPEDGNALEAGFDSKAYFDVTGTLTWELYLQNKDYNPSFDSHGHEGGIYRATATYTDVKAREHYHLTFELGEGEASDGAFIVKVILDSSMEESSHELVLDFDNRNLPSYATNAEFDVTSGEALTVPIGNTVTKQFTVKTPVGVKSLRAAHSSESLVQAGFPAYVEFIGASSELIQSLSDAGVVISQASRAGVPVQGAVETTIDLTRLVASLPVGNYSIEFTAVDLKGHFDVFEFVFEIISDVDAEAVAAYTGWAAFAKLEGRFFAADAPDGLTFQYRKATADEWTELDPSHVDINTATLRYSAVLTGLEPSTSYVFRAVSAEDKETKEISFSTSSAATIHNLSFDYWYKSGDAWMPNQNSDNYVWDTANPGTASLGYIPTTPEETTVVKGKAARLETQLAQVMFVKKLAAGNIYTGQFVKVAGVGAELDWGIPFSSRPLALRGYMKYAPKTIDYAESPHTDKKGKTDFCQIQMFLTDWTGTFRISTSSKQFVDYTSSSIIARGEMHTDATHNGYVKFTIPLVYRDNRTPAYAVISAAASMYGDYFTGAVGSVLLLDEFELVYDPAELTEEEYNAVFSQINPF